MWLRLEPVVTEVREHHGVVRCGRLDTDEVHFSDPPELTCRDGARDEPRAPTGAELDRDERAAAMGVHNRCECAEPLVVLVEHGLFAFGNPQNGSVEELVPLQIRDPSASSRKSIMKPGSPGPVKGSKPSRTASSRVATVGRGRWALRCGRGLADRTGFRARRRSSRKRFAVSHTATLLTLGIPAGTVTRTAPGTR